MPTIAIQLPLNWLKDNNPLFTRSFFFQVNSPTGKTILGLPMETPRKLMLIIQSSAFFIQLSSIVKALSQYRTIHADHDCLQLQIQLPLSSQVNSFTGKKKTIWIYQWKPRGNPVIWISQSSAFFIRFSSNLKALLRAGHCTWPMPAYYCNPISIEICWKVTPLFTWCFLFKWIPKKVDEGLVKKEKKCQFSAISVASTTQPLLLCPPDGWMLSVLPNQRSAVEQSSQLTQHITISVKTHICKPSA